MKTVKFNKITFFSALAMLVSIFSVSAQKIETTDEGPKKFEFKYKEGDSYRILSTVEEDVYINGYKHHTAEVLNRITVKVHDVDEKNMTAVNEGTFMTSENSVLTSTIGKKTFSYGDEYKSTFTKDRFGVYTIDDNYFMPTVRDVPVFPDRELAPGDEWTYEGHEAHDLRRSFNLQKPYKVPFNAKYKYFGVYKEKEDGPNKGKKFDLFQVYYEMSFTLDTSKLAIDVIETPYKTTGFSSQLIFWDNEKGTIDHYMESFKIEITTTAGNVLTFIGNAHAEVTEFQRTATVENIEDVSQKIADLGIEDVTVKKTDKGLTLSIENIQFKPDSDILLLSEKKKLDKLKEILEAYPDNDILVTGHTALRGDAVSRQQLSDKRAEAVADYLVKIGVRDNYHIFTQGKGAEEPIADNKTEAGRKKNRRVEITIMD
ncbi:OmpA family protein [Treponema sp.]|uniref:OmpA family protein n=1 Tax=Treponema sp. TaxID=166 RepID=UPI00298DD955|nr:OmpA family protein [Treponema sp.]